MNKKFLFHLFIFISSVSYLKPDSGFTQANSHGDLLVMLPAILAAVNHQTTPTQPPATPTTEQLSLRIFVAGESVEEFNHMNSAPFNENGSLNGTSNGPEEYGWMVPFSERLKLRDSKLSVQWIGSNCWTDQVTWECSTGTLSNQNIGHTSAQAGSTIEVWQADHGDELKKKEHCYDIAFASRGGNDLDQDVSPTVYENQLRQLVLDLDQGSNCRNHPVIYVTAHMLDSASWNYGYSQGDIDSWMATQKSYYVDIAYKVTADLNSEGRHVQFIDMWTPFFSDKATTAFPSESWWTVTGGTRVPDMEKIHRDGQHPKRLASIFAGENAADQININEVRTILGQ